MADGPASGFFVEHNVGRSLMSCEKGCDVVISKRVMLDPGFWILDKGFPA